MSKASVRQGGSDLGPATNRATLPTVPQVGMSGDFPSRVTVAPGSTTSVILASAEEYGTDLPVLVPFLDLKISGILQSEISEDSEDQDFGTLLSGTLPLENAVFLYFDLVRDLQIALGRLTEASGGGIGLEPQRMRLAHVFAKLLCENAAELENVLASMAEATDAARSQPAEQPAPDHSKEPRSSGKEGTSTKRTMRVRPRPAGR